MPSEPTRNPRVLACWSPSSASRYAPLFTRLGSLLSGSLTILFLLLPGISGPGSGVWWLDVQYEDGDGSNWQMGGLGACQSNTTCHVGEIAPKHWGQVHSLLMFHLASATIVFLLMTFSAVLLHFPESRTTQKYGTLIPVLVPVLPCIVLISDIAVAHAVEVGGDVENVTRVGGYWLGPASFPMSVLWTIAAEYHAHFKRKEMGDELPPPPPRSPRRRRGKKQEGLAEKAVGAAVSVWPWRGRREGQ